MLDLLHGYIIMHVKADDFYKHISNNVDNWFDTSNFNKNDNRPLEIGKKQEDHW